MRPAGIVTLMSIVVVMFTGVGAGAEHAWLDADGNPLPFQDDIAILEFLKSARVIAEKPIGVGINQSVRVTLEREGVRAHAIFREVDRRKRSVSIERVRYQLFADSYLFECAAYELAKLIGMPRIPPAVLRSIGGRHGSLQLWLEDALDEDSDDFAPPNALRWGEQLWEMYLFDNLIYNIDRNAGNRLVSKDYQLWMIDHTRAFQFKNELLDDRVVRVRRKIWEKLVALTEDEIRDSLRAYLTPTEMSSVITRRDLLEQRIEQLVAERSEGTVFY